jgi:GNAT superfamily N-acetyltransferase
VSGLGIQILEYRNRDLDDVVKFNRLITENWYHYRVVNHNVIKGNSDKVENLSSFEQWYHGGPWNNPEMFELYVNLVKKCGGTIFLARTENGGLVGEVDCCLADNYKAGYILWILTHPKYRRKSIGTELISTIIKYFTQKNISRIVVIPEDEQAGAFYSQVGFTPLENRVYVEFPRVKKSIWKETLHKYSIKQLNLDDKVKIFAKLYPLIGSSESNNYITQLALNQREIRKILGNEAVLSNFIPPLWIYKTERKIAIFGHLGDIRVWISKEGLMNSKFIDDVIFLIRELHSSEYIDSNSYSWVMKRDYQQYLSNLSFLAEEPVLILNVSD